jgi:DNA repair photolyase
MTVEIQRILTKSILSRATGYINAFDFTLNPYSGCAFGCEYCYAAAFAPSLSKRLQWGEWVTIKANAVELLAKRGEQLRGKTIFMSSVTDPYQPIEQKLQMTRRLLAVMRDYQPRLVVQTRSPLVTRDIDLLCQLDTVRVNMSLTTDDETIRKEFEPSCPSIARRFQALAALKAAGIPIGVCLAPLLPVRDAQTFGERLQALAPEVVVAQPLVKGCGRFAATTREAAWEKAARHGWNAEAYDQAIATLRSSLPHLVEGREGFSPA